MTPTHCPACGAAAGDQVSWMLDDEPCWCCPFCGCIYAGLHNWLNPTLGQDVLDPIPNDGWDGAAGAELRDADHYEPYPHLWDWDLKWCRAMAAIKGGLYHELATIGDPETGRDLLDIPLWIIRRALVALPERYREPDIF